MGQVGTWIKDGIIPARCIVFCDDGVHLWLSEVYGEDKYYAADTCVICGELRINVESPPPL